MKWQPIETAPRNGTAILIHNNHAPGLPGGRMRMCDGTNTVVAEWWTREWICYMDQVEEPRCPFEPTHWMPLPNVPSGPGDSNG